MVRGRLTKAAAEDCRTNLNSNTGRMKTRLAQGKLLKDGQQSITKFFEVDQCRLVNSKSAVCDFAITIPSRTIIKQDYFETKDALVAAFEKSPKIQKLRQLSSGSPSHRIQLNSEEILPNLDTKSNKNQTNINPTERKLTEFFPIRRSERKTKKRVQEEKRKSLEEQVRSDCEDGLEVHDFNGKGRGIVASKPFNRGDFVVEYSGELLDMAQARQREEKYAQDSNAGCYMYYFKYQNRQFCIDATAETGRLGRLINHSRNGNLITRTVVVDTLPRLVFIAKDFINVGEELSYDYGDRSKDALKHHPWLAV